MNPNIPKGEAGGLQEVSPSLSKPCLKKIIFKWTFKLFTRHRFEEREAVSAFTTVPGYFLCLWLPAVPPSTGWNCGCSERWSILEVPKLLWDSVSWLNLGYLLRNPTMVPDSVTAIGGRLPWQKQRQVHCCLLSRIFPIKQNVCGPNESWK